jgi:hypothetical protein
MHGQVLDVIVEKNFKKAIFSLKTMIVFLRLPMTSKAEGKNCTEVISKLYDFIRNTAKKPLNRFV